MLMNDYGGWCFVCYDCNGDIPHTRCKTCQSTLLPPVPFTEVLNDYNRAR